MPQTTFKSFHSLSVEHPGFVKHPKFWTDHHLAVVNCSFQRVEGDDAQESVVLDTEQAKQMTKSALRLACENLPDMKHFWVAELLLGNKPTPITFIHESDYRLYFDYGHYRVPLWDSNVCIYRIKEEICIPDANPTIGYYRYTADEERKQKLRARRGRGGVKNDPFQRICDIKRRQVTPTDWRHDPYIVCLLLSVAQLQDRMALAPPEGTFLARLLVTNMDDPTNAYVYKADIPHQLLDSLDVPTRTIEDFVFPTVNYVVVPFEPYSTFADRVRVQLAGKEYFPQPGPARSDPVSPSESHGEKRKRDEE
ncbi:uncharacterized protein FTJAE_3697 [Fusarium tjaetaba]|uniref:Uncharacterized protein n=1 Tax=Fusarium tjaetaba TaxID=1567544 RepID=A0A8H5RYJ0_9HYPO|nr:uncharacterized protein FTJAE_3697 [Fusarium tjaetaba]KAF5642222.1 hypothetical protein FTJAE_3697 [Fusarium tjaetaba]